MREITRLPAEELEQKAERDEARIDRILREAVMRSGRKIVVLDDGVVVGIGTHAELMDSCEVYREIYNSQYKKNSEEVSA